MTAQPLIAAGVLKEDALKGQVAIVTGGGGGIGFEAARALAWLGARVVLADKDKLAENLKVIQDWQKEVERLINYLKN